MFRIYTNTYIDTQKEREKERIIFIYTSVIAEEKATNPSRES